MAETEGAGGHLGHLLELTRGLAAAGARIEEQGGRIDRNETEIAALRRDIERARADLAAKIEQTALSLRADLLTRLDQMEARSGGSRPGFDWSDLMRRQALTILALAVAIAAALGVDLSGMPSP